MRRVRVAANTNYDVQTSDARRAPAQLRLPLLTWALTAALLGYFLALAAGGGPENVLLLVNSNSESSKTIANHYIELRKIPPNNVVYIDWKGNLESGSAERLREVILRPALAAIDERKLLPQIDYIVYSSDFPWRVELQPAFFRMTKFPSPFEGWASITGATICYHFSSARIPAIVIPTPTGTCLAPGESTKGNARRLRNVPSRGFRSRYLGTAAETRSQATPAGQRYLLSTMLGVTQGRGNSWMKSLTIFVGPPPPTAHDHNGTIYFMWNKDIRSATRDKCFEAVAAKINAIPGACGPRSSRACFPTAPKDVAGLMIGTPLLI